MENLIIIILLSACISVLIVELLVFIGKGIIFIGYIIANKSAEINFKGNITIIAILSFIVTFLLLMF